MTEPERAALDHIRRVVEAVTGVTSATPEPAPAAEPHGVNCLPVPYISQLVGEGTANDSGAAAGAMLLRAYKDSTITPGEFLNQVGEFPESALTQAQVAMVLKANGVAVEPRSKMKLSDLALVLFSGRPAIVLVRQIVLNQGGLTPEVLDGPHFLVCVGLDQKYVYAHDPLRRDESGEAQAIPWLTFYRAWTQVPGAERTALVPRAQLLRRVRVSVVTANMVQDPREGAEVVLTAGEGEVFEVSVQKDGWGKVGVDRWIHLHDVMDI